MASGTITLTRKGNGLLDGRIVWESTSNGISANNSTVTATLQLMRNASRDTTSGTFKGTFTVATTTRTISKFLNLPHGEWVTVETISLTVSHSKDGSGNCYIHAAINGPTQTSMEGTSVSGSSTVTLDKITRFATILSATDFTDEENPTITYSNPAGSATTKLQACISVTGEDDDVEFRDIPINGKSYTFSLTTAERDVLRSAAANSNTLALKFVVRSTVSGVEGKTNAKATMTVVNANPTATFSVVDTNATTVALTGNSNRFIALHSIAEVTMTVTTKKSATIPSGGVRITDGTTVWSKNGAFNGVISPLSSGNINYTVTDSRGNQTGGGVASTFVAYFNPKIQIDSITRDGSGNLTVVASGEAFVGSFGSKSNTRTLYYRYKKSTDENYTSWMQLSSSEVVWDGNKFTATKKISGLDYTKSYNVHVSITDSLHTGDDRVIARKTGLSTIPIFDWGSEDFRFNVPVYDQTGELVGNTGEEWQNPPMEAATQYGTRERHLGNRVYVKLVDLGSLPNTSTKNVSYNNANDVKAFAFEVFARASSDDIIQVFPLARTSDGAITARANVTDYSVEIKTFADLSHYTGFAKIKYTKG